MASLLLVILASRSHQFIGDLRGREVEVRVVVVSVRVVISDSLGLIFSEVIGIFVVISDIFRVDMSHRRLAARWASALSATVRP